MKSTSTFLVAFLLSFVAYGQTLEKKLDGNFGYRPHPSTAAEIIRKDNSFGKANAISDWYFQTNALINSAPNKNVFQTLVSFIFPDTNVIMTDDGDTARFWPNLHSFGQVIDPKDEVFDFQDPPISSTGNYVRFAKRDAYTIDSLAFRYLYIRNIEEQDNGNGLQTIVDTLFIEYYKGIGQQGATGAYGLESSWQFVNNGDTNRFSRPAFSLSKGAGSTVIRRETILLTNADTTGKTDAEDNGWRSQYRVLSVGIPMSANEIFGYAVYFKPGSVYSVKDTILSTGPKKPAKRTANYFGFMFIENQSNSANEQIPQINYFNNLYWIPPGWIYDIADPNRGALDFGFISGTAYDKAKYIPTQFHISGSSSLNTEEVKKTYALGVYPNPIRVGEQLQVEYKVDQSTEVSLEVYDLLGKKLTSTTAVSYAGINTSSIATGDLSTGMYFVSMKVGNEIVATKKFNVIR